MFIFLNDIYAIKYNGIYWQSCNILDMIFIRENVINKDS